MSLKLEMLTGTAGPHKMDTLLASKFDMLSLRLDASPVITTHERVLAIAESGHGTDASSLLADDARWGVAVWKLRPEVIPALCEVIERTGAHLRKEFVLRALWVGEGIEHRWQGSLPDFTALIRANALPARTECSIVPELIDQR